MLASLRFSYALIRLGGRLSESVRQQVCKGSHQGHLKAEQVEMGQLHMFLSS